MGGDEDGEILKDSGNRNDKNGLDMRLRELGRESLVAPDLWAEHREG